MWVLKYLLRTGFGLVGFDLLGLPRRTIMISCENDCGEEKLSQVIFWVVKL